MSKRDYFAGTDTLQEERILTFIESMDTGLPQELTRLEQEALENEVPVIRTQTQSLIRFLLALKRPQRILEIGTATGFSALFMHHYAPDARIVTIEKDPERVRQACRNFEGIQAITCMEADAGDALKELASGSEQYDFVLLDAAKGQYIHYLPCILDLMAPGGVLVSDDIFQEGDILQSRFAVRRRDRTIHRRMREYLDAITHHTQLYTVLLEEGNGTALSIKRDREI